MKDRKALRIAVNVITWVIVAFVVVILIAAVVSMARVGRTDASLFGYRMYIVESDSMKGEFNAGDLIFSKVYDDYSDLEDGTIITFISEDSVSFGETITHKIRSKTEDGTGYITYGIATDTDDTTACPIGNIIGVYKFRIPKMGYFVNFLQSTVGYIVVIVVPFTILIIIFAVRLIRAISQMRKQKALEAGEAKEDENERLRAEIERLKAELGGNSPPGGDKPPLDDAAPEKKPSVDPFTDEEK